MVIFWQIAVETNLITRPSAPINRAPHPTRSEASSIPSAQTMLSVRCSAVYGGFAGLHAAPELLFRHQNAQIERIDGDRHSAPPGAARRTRPRRGWLGPSPFGGALPR